MVVGLVIEISLPFFLDCAVSAWSFSSLESVSMTFRLANDGVRFCRLETPNVTLLSSLSVSSRALFDVPFFRLAL